MSNPIETAQNILKISLDDMGKLLGKSKPTIINYKNKPEMITFDVLKKLSDITGCSIDYLTSDGEGFNPGPKLMPVFKEFNSQIMDKLDRAELILKEIEDLEIDENSLVYLTKKRWVQEIENLIELTKFYIRKPRIVALGQYDSGKSTLGNYLLGEDKIYRNDITKEENDKTPRYILPAEYSPYTTTITYLHGIEDKPNYFEDLQDTIVIGRNKEESLEALSFDNYTDIKKEYEIRKGHHREILAEYCTRDGLYYQNDKFDIDSIHVFLDNDFLREVDYVDVPGFGSGNEKDEVALTTKMYQADIIFYLSQADAFFKESDLSILSSILNVRGNNTHSLDSIFILGTHANSIGNSAKVIELMEKGIDRLIGQMTDGMLRSAGISKDDYTKLRERCFGFDPKSETYTNALNKEIVNSVEKIIRDKMQVADEGLCKAAGDLREKSVEIYEELIGILSGEAVNENVISVQKDKAKKSIIEIKKSLGNSVREHRRKSIKELTARIDSFIEEKNLETLIDKKGIRNKSESFKDFASYINNELNDILSDILKRHSEEFTAEVNESIESYKNIWTESDVVVDVKMNTFNYQNAFAAGLAGASVYGALALWASVVAGSSNLGAYILIVKIVSFLSSLGISLGGTAVVTSTVAAIGGPVTIGITVALLTTGIVFGILTGSWKKRAAKKIVEAFNDENVKAKYMEKISDYWMETGEALDSCLDSLHDETMKEFDTRIQAAEEGVDKQILERVYEVISDAYEILEEKVV